MEVERLKLSLGISVAFATLVLVVAIANQVSVAPTPVYSTSVASSTLSVEPGFSLPPITMPSFEPATSTTSTSSTPTAPTTKKITPPAPKPVPEATPTATTTPVAVPVSVPVPAPLPTNAELDAAASTLRAALVNIICYVPVGSGLHSISASGVFIDSKGIILTNAHVAQYFLLADRGASCTIRSGSPAANRYEAKLIFISPAWLHANSTILTIANPSGTGEYDYALLAVTKSVTTNSLPSSFPYISLATTPPRAGTPVVIATYGAQFLESSQVQSGLFPTVVFGSVKDIFTFATNTIDVLALGGSAAAQEGSSGGGVASASGELVGTITTSTILGSTDTRSLDAITASYIRAAYANETGSALDLLLAKPTSTAVADFAPLLPALESIITASLPS